MTGSLSIWGIGGIGEVRHGDDIAASLAGAEPRLTDGDVLVITSKIVSKAEGRIRTGHRDEAIDDETVRVVARRGATRIAETRHGFVLAAAGVDASNTRPGTVLLLPLDPDASARRIRTGLHEILDVTVGVVISDTFGRPWRYGLTDVAVGVAGIDAVEDLRGRQDSHGNELDVTVTAVADELAAAADLVKGKLEGVPAAAIRGLDGRVRGEAGLGAAAMVRPADEDMFRYGSRDVVTACRTVRDFTSTPVDPATVHRAVSAALAAPATTGGTPWTFVLVESADARKRLLNAQLGSADEVAPPLPASTGSAHSRVLRNAPYLVVPCLRTGDPVAPAAGCEGGEAGLAAAYARGAGVQNFLISLTAEGLGSCWLPASMFCRETVRSELGLPDGWEPVGAIGLGHPAEPLSAASLRTPEDVITVR